MVIQDFPVPHLSHEIEVHSVFGHKGLANKVPFQHYYFIIFKHLFPTCSSLYIFFQSGIQMTGDHFILVSFGEYDCTESKSLVISSHNFVNSHLEKIFLFVE